jgi:hypothetical protein
LHRDGPRVGRNGRSARKREMIHRGDAESRRRDRMIARDLVIGSLRTDVPMSRLPDELGFSGTFSACFL